MGRVWVDGCFDMMHFGHMNALRQARMYGDYLVVGVHSDEDIARYKGPPVMDERTRYSMVRACEWVNEVVEAAPYTTSLDVMDEYGCEYCVHGDDIVLDSNGRDSYEAVKKAGRFREIPRTCGISTTDILYRILDIPASPISPYSRGAEKFPFSTSTIHHFLNGRGVPKPDDKVIYVDGAFDLFHLGHVNLFKFIKEKLGNYLIVGIWDDGSILTRKLRKPIMSHMERTLSALSCKYVDEVIIEAPNRISHDFLKKFNISLVVRGHKRNDNDDHYYSVPNDLNILKTIHNHTSPHPLTTTSSIIQRLSKQSEIYIHRNLVKENKENSSFKN